MNKKLLIILGVIALVLIVALWVSWIVLGSRSLVFFILAVTGGMYLLTVLFLLRDMVVQWVKKTRTQTGLQKAVTSFLFIAVLVVIYLLVAQNQDRLDLTAEGLYRLSPQTISILESLTNELKIVSFRPDAATGPAIEYQENLLKTYKSKSDHITLQFVDPIKNPVLASEYDIQEEVTTIFEYGGTRAGVSIRDIIQQDAQAGRMTYRGEEAFTSAIKSLLAADVRYAYVLAGHGEFSPTETTPMGYSDFFDALTHDMIQWRILDLTRFIEIPERASLLIIGRPTHTISVAELDTIKDFVDNGGNLLVFVEHDTTILVNDLLREFGVHFEPNMVIEEENFIPQLGHSVFTPRLIPHAVTAPLIGRRLPVVVGGALTLTATRETNIGNVNLAITPLLLSSRTSYAERSLESIRNRRVRRDEDDLRGPLPLGFAVVRRRNEVFRTRDGAMTNTVESRLVVFGDVDMANNAYLAQWANKDLLLNAANFLVKRERQITLRPKAPLVSEYTLTSRDQAILISVAGILVLAYVISGIVIILLRRRRVKG